MRKYALTATMALALGFPAGAGAVTLRELAGCKPGTDDPVVTSTGLFTAHLVCDHLLLELPEAMYNRDMLLNTEFAALSGGSNFIAPGTRGGQPGRALCPSRQEQGRLGGGHVRDRGRALSRAGALRRGEFAADHAQIVRYRRARRPRRGDRRRHARVRQGAAAGVRARVHEALRHARHRPGALPHRQRQGVPGERRHPLLSDLARRPRRAAIARRRR